MTLAIAAGRLVVAAGINYRVKRPDRVAVLNALRDQINANYGFRNGLPRINYGPCGRFAKAFREQWNARFRDKINIAFVLTPDLSFCHHVLVKFPDGTYFDGGNGVLSEPQLLAIYPPDSRIEEMVQFDLNLLDQRVGGLNHDHYPDCPNYSETFTAGLIESHLARLPSDIN